MSEVHDREREARRLAFQRIVAYARGLDDLGAAWGALDAYRDAVAARALSGARPGEEQADHSTGGSHV